MLYAAFLRAINVGGRNTVTMTALKERFVELGFQEVRTFINSGNVVFEGAGVSPAALGGRLSHELERWLGFPVVVMVRRFDALARLVKARPFGALTADGPLKRYVAFLAKPVKAPAAELSSAKEGLETLQVRGDDVFLLSHPVNGHFGFPNLFLESKLEVAATSRNWSTIEMMVEAVGTAAPSAAPPPRGTAPRPRRIARRSRKGTARRSR